MLDLLLDLLFVFQGSSLEPISADLGLSVELFRYLCVLLALTPWGSTNFGLEKGLTCGWIIHLLFA